MVNSQSGLLGLSGVSNDMRELLESAPTDERCRLAIDVFCYRVRKYIGAYMAVLGQTDAVVFTGGIGENAPAVRAQVMEGLEGLGLALDSESNIEAVRCEADIASPDSPVRILVVPTNEELMIARDTLAVASASAAQTMEARAQ
jgi:acetate kinase